MCLSLFSLGQSTFLKKSDFGLALSYAPSEFAAALSWRQIHPVAAKGKFKMGYGLRLNGYTARELDYSTAPAYLTSGEKGPQVIFIENIQENIDTFRVVSSRHSSLNAAIYLEYAITPKWGVGFNIDAVGFSYGRRQNGTIVSSNSNGEEKVSAKPTPYNLLLISDNDIGMLNSELYATYRWSDRLSIHGGLTFLFTEYTTETKISYNDNNDRFRYKSLMAMLSVSYSPFR